MDDLISRQAAVDLADAMWEATHDKNIHELWSKLIELPSAQQEIKPIEYRECADAMLKMWMDKVVTDGEYNRIMDKLNAHWGRYNG